MNYLSLINQIQTIHHESSCVAVKAINRSLILRNWLIGGYLVEYQQKGEDRAQYGTNLLKRISMDLKEGGIQGISPDNLEKMRNFFSLYPQLRSNISETLSRKCCKILELSGLEISETPSRKLPKPLSVDKILELSWSHWSEIVRIRDPWSRAFYENECLKSSWSVRQLQRQISSLLYERTGLSTDKKTVIEAARSEENPTTGAIIELIRDPYVLEFAGLAEKHHYLEKDLEKALLDHLQSFLLELGNGFCFEARQKRITVGNEHDYLDLVFYHRILRCHLLIDLKTRAFQHGDAGQMNFYLNYWKDQMMVEGDHPPVGLILCTDKDQTKVEYATGGLDRQLFVSRYLVNLPTPETIQNLIESDRAHWDQQHGSKSESDEKEKEL